MFEKKSWLFDVIPWFIRDVSLQVHPEEYVLGCGVTRLEGDGAAVIHVRSTAAFKPHRLIIPNHVASGIIVTSFFVGDNNQLISSGAIPGEAFLSYVQTNLRLSVVPRGGEIALGVTNLFASPLDFSAAIIGTAL